MSAMAIPIAKPYEEAMAALEGGAVGLAFASGSAAAFAVLQALSPGDHILVSRDLYTAWPACSVRSPRPGASR